MKRDVIKRYLRKNKIDKVTYKYLAASRKATDVLGRSGGALYGLYSDDDHLLYLGYAQNLASRIGSHFNGNTNTSEYAHLVKYARYTYELDAIRSAYDKRVQEKYPDIEIQDIEFFAIKLLKPIFNQEKAEHLIFRYRDEKI